MSAVMLVLTCGCHVRHIVDPGHGANCPTHGRQAIIAETDDGPILGRQLQERAAAWRMAKYPGTTKAAVVAKLFEEAGELDRAAIGQLAGRPGRGDVGDEAAQVLLVLCSLIGQWYNERALFGVGELYALHPVRADDVAQLVGVKAGGPDEVLALLGLLAEHMGTVARAVRLESMLVFPSCALMVYGVRVIHRLMCPTRDLFADVEVELARHERLLADGPI